MTQLKRHGVLLAAVCACLFFFAAGLLFIPYTGPQFDEVLFGSANWGQPYASFYWETRWFKLPLLIMAYVGALKAILYKPILLLAGASVWSLRVPMLVAVTAALWISFLAVRRMAGPRVALFMVALLAADPNYLLTSVYDWGPVALQHLFLACTLYCGVRFSEDRAARWMLLGALSMGLAVWDKAVAVWWIVGFTAALVLVWPKQVLALYRRPKLVLAAAVLFLAGCAPVWIYNFIVSPGAIVEQSGTGVETNAYLAKSRMLDVTLSAHGLEGYMTRDQQAAAPADIKLWEKAAYVLDQRLGGPESGVQGLLVMLALLTVPLLAFTGRGRLVLWLVFGSLSGYFLMFTAKQGGGSLHHLILLWPAPALLVALAAGELADRFGRRGLLVACAAVGLGTATNLVMLNHLLAQFVSHGATQVWSDAAVEMGRKVSVHRDVSIAVTDWGIGEPIRFLTLGRVKQYFGTEGLGWGTGYSETHDILARIVREGTVWVGYTPGNELRPETNTVLVKFAASLGYKQKMLDKVADRHGREVYQIYTFVPEARGGN